MKSAIVVCVDELYASYIDLFTWCCQRSYPQTDIIVLRPKEIPKPYFTAVYRLLTPIEGYDYIYITDVDMMHLPLKPDLFDYHLNQMRQTGLSYSNSPRSKKSEHRGDERITGLHFCTPLWYIQTKAAREKYLLKLLNGEIGQQPIDDELTLMKVIKESGLAIPPKQQLIARHFGIHFGTCRAYRHHEKIGNTNRLTIELRKRITKEYARLWISYYDDPDFRKIVGFTGSNSKNMGIRRELNRIYVFCKGLLNER